ncbi:hypothetical protein [Bacillus kexueae]|uniref:hypothetical protein n=1 Tax=Aeribacillus kexueae TaxID=2078952 RepID=UPI001FB02849|nr:hypothetical protein [Bacillus kexueae]
MENNKDVLSELFDISNYIPREWDILTCEDGSLFYLTNGKLLGPTAWVLKGATIDSSKVVLKYQGFSLRHVINEIHDNHKIIMVQNGFWKVVRRIIKTNLNI